jgi:tetratricopeptide (TPR) repeat protein
MCFLRGKRFSFLVRLGVVAALVAVTNVGCSKQRSEQYRQEGDMYFGLGNYSQAEEAYRRAAEANPENAEARLGLGNVLALSGKGEQALESYQEALKLDPTNDRGYLRASMLLLSLGMPAEAVAMAQRLEEVKPELGGILHASILFRLSRETEALSLLESLRDRFPKSSLVRTHLAYVLLAAGEASSADTELKAAMELAPESTIGANMVLVETLAALGRIAEITDDRELIESQNPDEAMIYAHALNLAERPEEGTAIIRDVLERDSTSEWANFALASFLLDAGRRDEAAKCLQNAAEIIPWEAVVLYATLSPEKTNVALSSTESSQQPDQAPEATDAQTRPQQDWQTLWNQAALGRLLEQRSRFGDDDGEHLRETLVLAALFHGSNDLAKELAGELPDGSPAKTYMAALQNGDLQNAVDALAPWSDADGSSQVLAMNGMGYVMALGNARNEAVQVLSACAERYPDNGVSLYNLAQVFRVAELPRFAALAQKKLTAMFPENVEAHVALVQLLRDTGMLQEARQAAEAMYAIFPDSSEAILSICSTYADTQQLEPARRILDVYLEAHPNDSQVQFARAYILLIEGKAEQALESLSQVKPSKDLISNVTTLTALAHAMTQDWQSVVDLIGTDDPHTLSPSSRFILVAAYVNLGLPEKIESVLAGHDTNEPFGGPIGALILSSQNGATSSLANDESVLAKALAAESSTLADFTAGVAFQETKLHDEAYQAFKRVDESLAGDSDLLSELIRRSLPYAVRVEQRQQEALAFAERHEASGNAWLACAAMLRVLEDVEGERRALDMAAEVDPENPLVFIRRGDLFARQEDIRAAIVDFRRYVELRPDDPVGNNNLAYNLLLSGDDLEQALKFAKIAADALPRDPRVLHTLGVAQLRHGDLEESKKNLQSALQRMPGEPSLLLDYGQLLIKLGEIEEGRHHVENALNSANLLGMDFDRREEAESILAGATVVPEAI